MALPGISNGHGHLDLPGAGRLKAEVTHDDWRGRARLVQHRDEPLSMLVVRATEEPGDTTPIPLLAPWKRREMLSADSDA